VKKAPEIGKKKKHHGPEVDFLKKDDIKERSWAKPWVGGGGISHYSRLGAAVNVELPVSGGKGGRVGSVGVILRRR